MKAFKTFIVFHVPLIKNSSYVIKIKLKHLNVNVERNSTYVKLLYNFI